MKKILLLVAAFAFVLSGFSQKQFVAKKNAKLTKEPSELVKNHLPAPMLNTNKSANEDVNRIAVATGQNFRTVRRADTRVVSYNPTLDVISLTFVLDPATYGGANANGTTGIIYSADHGQTWSDPVVVVDNGNEGYIADYPSGIIYNPADNTNLDNALGVTQTIAHIGSDWAYKMWGSRTLAGENQNVEVVHDADNVENGYWNQFGLAQVNEDVRCLSMVPQGTWGSYESAELQPIYGDFDGTSFSWDYSQLIEMNLYQNTEDNTMACIGGYQGMDGGIEMAWADDGQTAYMWMVGTSADNLTGYQPIIFKTTDGGNSWDEVTLDFLTDEMQTYLDPYIIEANGGLMIPHIIESAGSVDYHGDLQLFVAMGSTSADVTIYPDSLGFHWGYPGDLFNITVDDNGIKDIIWMDSLRTENLVDADDGNYAGNGWNHRLFVAKNDFENEFFFTWTDTRDNSGTDKNINPDICGWSKNVHTGENSEAVCFTEGTLYEKFYFFTAGAERAFYNDADQTYTVPYIQVVTPGEFSSNGATDPVTINYVTGIEFPALGDYVGVDELSAVNNISVSQNTPNPFNGATTITVRSKSVAPVMLEVSNIMGQTVYTLNAGAVNGSKDIELNSNHMEAGVYFYTVTVGNESTTKKMIVQ